MENYSLKTESKNIWLINTKQQPIKGQLLLRHIWKGTPNECFSLWRFNEDVVIGDVRQYTTLNGSFRDYYKSFIPQYLYVTSQDPYSAGDWVKNVTIEAEPPFKLDVHGIRYTQLAPCKFEKVVLTTDEYLIQDGISSVEEEFLNWFCEKANDSGKAIDIVEVKKNYLSNNGEWKEVLMPSEWEADTKVGYKIVIPNEEPKQDYTALFKEVGAEQDFLMSLEKDPLLAEFDNQVEQNRKEKLGVDFVFSIREDGMTEEIPVEKAKVMSEYEWHNSETQQGYVFMDMFDFARQYSDYISSKRIDELTERMIEKSSKITTRNAFGQNQSVSVLKKEQIQIISDDFKKELEL